MRFSPATLYLGLGFLSIVAVTATALADQSIDALSAEHVSRACDGPGALAAGGLHEIDLTGDGSRDLILDHSAISCSNGTSSNECGMRACAIYLYVREGDRLQVAYDSAAVSVTVGSGEPPAITFVDHFFTESIVRWTGKAFAPVAAAERGDEPTRLQTWSAGHRADVGAVVATGCASKSLDDAWTCLVARCGPAGELEIYIDAAGSGRFSGDWILAVDKNEFSVSAVDSKPGDPLTARIEGDVAGILASLKSGRNVHLRLPASRALKPGYDRISLRGSERAITQVERTCSRSTAMVPADHTAPEPKDREGKEGSAPAELGAAALPDIGPVDPSGSNARGVALNRNGDEVAGFALIQSAAAGGDLRALANVGIMLRDGVGTPKNLKAGIDALRRAHEAGDPFATVGLGHSYLTGTGVPQSYTKAYELLASASESIAGPEANFYLHQARSREVMDASAQLSESYRNCMKADRAGHRPAIIYCFSPSPHNTDYRRHLRDFERAVQLKRWSSGKNIEAAYVKEFFFDNDERLAWLVSVSQGTIKDWLNVDLKAHLARFGFIYAE